MPEQVWSYEQGKWSLIDNPLQDIAGLGDWYSELGKTGYATKEAEFGAAPRFSVTLHAVAQPGAVAHPFLVAVVLATRTYPIYCADFPSALELLERLMKLVDSGTHSAVEEQRQADHVQKLQLEERTRRQQGGR